jgi:hypothetical protein
MHYIKSMERPSAEISIGFPGALLLSVCSVRLQIEYDKLCMIIKQEIISTSGQEKNIP